MRSKTLASAFAARCAYNWTERDDLGSRLAAAPATSRELETTLTRPDQANAAAVRVHTIVPIVMSSVDTRREAV